MKLSNTGQKLCWHTISFRETHLLFRYIRGLIEGIRKIRRYVPTSAQTKTSVTPVAHERSRQTRRLSLA
jgi:hypothetical protein